MPWTSEERALLHELRKTCVIHMFLQSGSAYVNNVFHNAMVIPTIAIGSVLSAYLFSDSNPRWRLASGVLAVTSTAMTSVVRQLKPGEKAHAHALTMQQYQSLIQDIHMHLHMDVPDHEKPVVLQTIRHEMDKMFRMQQDPSIFVVRYFEKKYKTSLERMLYEEFEQFERIAQRMSTRVSAGIFLKKPAIPTVSSPHVHHAAHSFRRLDDTKPECETRTNPNYLRPSGYVRRSEDTSRVIVPIEESQME